MSLTLLLLVAVAISLIRIRSIGLELRSLRERLSALESALSRQRLPHSEAHGVAGSQAAGGSHAAPVQAATTTPPAPAAPPDMAQVAPPAARVPLPSPRPAVAAPSAAADAPPPRPPLDPTHGGPSYGTPPPPPPPAASIEWERWIGIRGAAVLGAIVLGLAGLLFFQYSIERGLITPSLRVALGVLVGLACVAGAELMRPRGYRATAEGIAGAGIVILYAAFWAAHSLYDLIGAGLTFLLMALVTLACGTLAIRHASQVVAVLGLMGGFATPLLLRTNADRPIGLFGYILLLDLGLLAISRKRIWPWLGMLGLAGTVLLQALWIGIRMGPDRLLLGLAILAVFAAAFAASGQLMPAGRRGAWMPTQAGALFFPFAFGVYFAARADLGERLAPLAVLLGLLSLAAAWISRANATPSIATGAAIGGLAVIAVWLVRTPVAEAQAWQAAAAAIGLSLIFHLFVELDPPRAEPEGTAPAAMIAASGHFLLLAVAAGVEAGSSIWPWLVGGIGLCAILYRHASFRRRAALQVVAAVAMALLLTFFQWGRARLQGVPDPSTLWGILVAACVAAQVAALLRRSPATRRMAEHAAAAAPVTLLAGLAFSPWARSQSVTTLLGGSVLLALLALMAATRLPSGGWHAGAMGATLLCHLSAFSRLDLRADAGASRAALGLAAVTVSMFTLWPLMTRARFSVSRQAWYAAALAGPLWFLPMRDLFLTAFGDSFIGALPVGLGALALAGAAGARGIGDESAKVRRQALVWFCAVAISFVSVAIPLQLEKEWITIGWALEGLGLVVLWRRLDHPGLKWFAAAALVAATARLVANPALLAYYPRSGLPVLNWILYTYLVPAAALLGAAALLRPVELARARQWERPAYRRAPTVAILTGLCAITVTFVWINLAIADWFTDGPALTLRFGRSPARDLTVSVAWALYALGLLVFGMVRDSGGLRWMSMGFLVVTIGKVFLYDLDELRDLYRVASLVGLAISLLLVSVLYQRLVFPRKDAPREGTG